MNSLIQSAVAEAIRRQSFFQRNANTIVAGIGAVTALLSFLVTLPLPIDDKYTGLVPSVVAFLTVFAVKLTPNGVQPSTADKLENTIAAGIHSTLALHDGLAVHVMPSSSPDDPVTLPTYTGESVGDIVDDHEEPVRGRHAL